MAERPVLLTPEGKTALEQELDRLFTQRKEITKRIQEERQIGAFAEGGEFDEAKHELAFVDGKIHSLERQLRNAVIVDGHKTSEVSLGSTVVVSADDGETERYTIVGSPEANPSVGKISHESPVGRALLGKRVGDQVSVQVPSGTLSFTILEIN
jgi:transcription elongation factor GreA